MTVSDKGFFYAGDALGVIMIHGLAGTPKEMRFVGKSLARKGFTVHGPPLAGHCGDEDDLVATGWRDWAGSVRTAVEDMRRRTDHIFLVGLSMGALLALYAAREMPRDIAGVALYSTTLWHDGWAVPRRRLFAPLLDLLVLLPAFRRYRIAETYPYGLKDERIRDYIVASMRGNDSAEAGLYYTPAASIAQHHALARRVRRMLPTIRTPALIAHATEDDIAGPRNVAYLQRNLAGPVRSVLLRDSYHLITIDRDRHKVVEETARFFQTLSRSTAHAIPADPPARSRTGAVS